MPDTPEPTIAQRMNPMSEAWAWWFRFNLIWVVSLFVLVGTALCAGPGRWTHGNSLQRLNDAFPAPWPMWGALFYIIAALLVVDYKGYTRLAGYFLGLIVAFFFIALSIVFSVVVGKFTNPITIGLSTLSVPQLMSGVRYSVIVFKANHWDAARRLAHG